MPYKVIVVHCMMLVFFPYRMTNTEIFDGKKFRRPAYIFDKRQYYVS